jgi:hypothetical protein
VSTSILNYDLNDPSQGMLAKIHGQEIRCKNCTHYQNASCEELAKALLKRSEYQSPPFCRRFTFDLNKTS